MNRRQELFDIAHDNGIKILTAKAGDQYKVGIHLLHPDLDALADALDTAIKDMFPAIYIHRGNPQGLKNSHLKLVKS